MITAILSLLLLVDATEASASTPAPAPAAKTTPAEETKVCKREASTESRLGNKRICLTKEQWKLRERSEG